MRVIAEHEHGKRLADAASAAQNAGVELHLVPVARQTRFRFSLRYARKVLAAARGADVVSVHGFYQFPCVAGWLGAVLADCRLFVQPHGVFEPYQEARGSAFKPLFMIFLGRWILRRSSVIWAASEQELSGIRAVAGRGAHVRVAPLGVRPRNSGCGLTVSNVRGRRTVLYIGRLAPKKRVDKLIDAARYLEQSGAPIRLIVCGSGDAEFVDMLRGRARGLSGVRFLGEVSGGRRRDAELLSDLFCLPSDNENFGQVVTEAMSAGLPVITTTGVGASEHVLRAGSGWVLQDPTVRDLAHAIDTALDDLAALRAMGLRGRDYVEETLSWAAVARGWVAAARSA